MSGADRAALVTGAGSGIGRATAELLLARGWHVVAADVDREALDALRAQHPDAPLTPVAVDITDPEAIAGAAEACAGIRPPLRAIVNCAGIGAVTPLMETTREEMRRLYEVDVVSQLAISQALIPQLRAAGGGAIVHVASVSGLKGSVGRAAYGAAKGALVTLTAIMAVELAPDGIRVNAVAPGPIDTPQSRRFHTDAIREEWRRTIPLRRYGTPDEVAATIAFLADAEQSGYTTGQVLAVDGGFTAAGLMT